MTIAVDRRVELVSMVFRLAGNPEYQSAPPTPYVVAVDAAIKPHADHPVIAATKALRERHGIGYDAPMILAVHLDDQLQPRAIDELPALDARWQGVDAVAYAAQLRDFATVVKLDELLAAHADYFAKAAAALRTVVEAEQPVAWFDAKFGARDRATFTVVPGPLNGRNNFGVRATVGGTSELYQILGIPHRDGLPDTSEDTVSLLVHEMAHSYVNPVFERHRAALARAGQHLFGLLEKRMRAQAYTEWKTMLNEAGVRALTTLYLREKHGAEAGARAARAEQRRGFVWTNELVEVFRKHPRGTSLEAAMPAVIAFFEGLHRAYEHGLPKLPFQGPFDAALEEPVFVAPRHPGLAAYVKTVHGKLFAAMPLVTASETTLRDHPGRNLVAYGAPGDNPVVQNILRHARIDVTPDAIVIGTKRFTGPGLVLAFARFRWDEPSRGVAVYTAARSEDLVGLNHGLRHGSTDWLVAKKTPKGYEVLGQGDFPRAVDGAWTLP